MAFPAFSLVGEEFIYRMGRSSLIRSEVQNRRKKRKERQKQATPISRSFSKREPHPPSLCQGGWNPSNR